MHTIRLVLCIAVMGALELAFLFVNFVSGWMTPR